MTRYAIMQEPGVRARARRAKYDPVFSPPMKRAGTVEAEGAMDALGQFVHERYLATSNKQYAGHRFEWRGERSNAAWRANDGADPGTRGRRWRVVVTLRNGRNEHDAIFEAWEAAS